MLNKLWSVITAKFESSTERKLKQNNELERELALERQRLAKERMLAQSIIPQKEEVKIEEKPSTQERHDQAA